MPEHIAPAALKYWPIVATCLAFISGLGGWLYACRSKSNKALSLATAHDQLLFDEHKQVLVVTKVTCQRDRLACSQGICGKVDEIKGAINAMAAKQERQIKALHEKREVESKLHANDIKDIHYFMGRMAGKMDIAGPPLSDKPKGGLS